MELIYQEKKEVLLPHVFRSAKFELISRRGLGELG